MEIEIIVRFVPATLLNAGCLEADRDIGKVRLPDVSGFSAWFKELLRQHVLENARQTEPIHEV